MWVLEIEGGASVRPASALNCTPPHMGYFHSLFYHSNIHGIQAKKCYFSRACNTGIQEAEAEAEFRASLSDVEILPEKETTQLLRV